MTYTFSDCPLANDTLATDQPLMRANFQYLSTALGVDHKIAQGDVSGTPEGYHKTVHLLQQTPPVAAVSNVGELYAAADPSPSTDVGLFFQNGLGVPIQLFGFGVSPANANPGASFLAGNIFIQWIATTISGSGAAYTFSGLGMQNFPHNCFGLVGSINAAMSGSISFSLISNTGFTAKCSAGSLNCFIIAIGN